jgi:hypothetical protein
VHLLTGRLDRRPVRRCLAHLSRKERLGRLAFQRRRRSGGMREPGSGDGGLLWRLHGRWVGKIGHLWERR